MTLIRLQNAVQTTFKKYWKELPVLGLYLILTLILLCPFSVLNMGSSLIGDGRDGYQGLWNLWWVKRSTLSLSNPYVTDHLYYPYGADLYFHSLSSGVGFLSIPFQLAFGLVFTYNLIVILSFVLAGYGAYCLAHYITGDKKASFFGGLVFAFSAYHFARALEHMNLVSIQWIPFYVLFLLKMRQEKSFTNVFLAAAFLVLAGLTADLQYVFFMGMLTVFFVVYQSISSKEGFTKFLVRLGSMTAVSAGALLLFLAPTVFGLFSGKYAYAISSPGDSVILSADLLAFLTPNSWNLFFGSLTGGVISSFSSSPLFPVEGVAYVGYTVLALAVYAAVKLKRSVRFWLLTALAFIVLSLGPMLHVMGSASFTVFHVNIPLPELVLYYVFPVFRAPVRFIVMATLCLSVISAVAIKQVNLHIGKLHGRILVLLFLAILSTTFIAESNMLPYPTVEDTSVPEFYRTLASMKGDFSVLDLPQTYQTNNLYMYYGTVSEKPLVGGSISRSSPEDLILQQAIPLIRQTLNVLSGENLTKPTDIILQDVNLTNINSFKFFGVKYVVLHRDFMNSTCFKTMASYLDSLMGAPVYTDERIVAYEVKAQTINGTFAFVTSGWWNLEEEDTVPIRWMERNATIQVYSSSNQYCTLNFTVGTDCPDDVVLNVSLNGEWMGNILLFSREPETVVTQGFFRAGVNELSFSANQTFVPAEVNTTSTDTRQLSVYIQNLEISPY